MEIGDCEELRDYKPTPSSWFQIGWYAAVDLIISLHFANFLCVSKLGKRSLIFDSMYTLHFTPLMWTPNFENFMLIKFIIIVNWDYIVLNLIVVPVNVHKFALIWRLYMYTFCIILHDIYAKPITNIYHKLIYY